ncbi:prolyl 4-hydroxylase subunit alpha-2-like isoform X1 [Anneissia japonica]|uniref:prolyl 4-hydroxylase subunit alpha-2-like isoform X1 n=1 Tax=Anneissia japonica TaxID=1529436 RepID=UPI00142567D7|nr:prolyl 4-hydroxylase subunit alpha-2-like isoform X1 [Anneissia japonica]
MVSCCFPRLVIFILAIADLTVAELFSSLSHLKHLGDVEFELIAASRNYVAKSSVLLLNPEYIGEYPKVRQEYLEEISSFIEEVEPISMEAVQDMSIHVTHPIHVYQLIRRFVTFWNKLKTLVDWEAGRGR